MPVLQPRYVSLSRNGSSTTRMCNRHFVEHHFGYNWVWMPESANLRIISDFLKSVRMKIRAKKPKISAKKRKKPKIQKVYQMVFAVLTCVTWNSLNCSEIDPLCIGSGQANVEVRHLRILWYFSKGVRYKLPWGLCCTWAWTLNNRPSWKATISYHKLGRNMPLCKIHSAQW